MRHEITLQGYKVWQKEYDGKIKYSISFGSKRRDGGFDNAYMPVRFPKGFSADNGAEINGKGFISFTTYEGKHYWYIVIMDYEIVGGKPEEEQVSGFEEAYGYIPF